MDSLEQKYEQVKEAKPNIRLNALKDLQKNNAALPLLQQYVQAYNTIIQTAKIIETLEKNKLVEAEYGKLYKKCLNDGTGICDIREVPGIDEIQAQFWEAVNNIGSQVAEGGEPLVSTSLYEFY